MKLTEFDSIYLKDLQRIKEIVNENRSKAMAVANSAMIITYYQIGELINKRKKWGNKFVERLAIDLKDYGRGFSLEQLKRMSKFATYFEKSLIVAQAVPEIPWSTIIIIMNKSSSLEEMHWYAAQASKNHWSRSMVIKQFELQAYQRNEIAPLTSNESVLKEMIKDTLAFDFISDSEVSNESDLKQKLLDNIILFLQELGPGFALVGKEYRLLTPSNKNFYIDLLMYHTKIHCYVVIEVKIDEVSPQDFGQLNFYVNAINDLEKTEIDNPTVGILLCKTADSYVVKTSIQGLTTPIGVSKYRLLEDLPNYLTQKLKKIDLI